MTKGKWVEAEPDRAVACETAFQNGGPRVYTYEDWKQRPAPVSAKKAIEQVFQGQMVYARRKQGQQYVWMRWIVPGPVLPLTDAIEQVKKVVLDYTGHTLPNMQAMTLIEIGQRILANRAR